jgi:tetratricopeptide (TPR) repeat protein
MSGPVSKVGGARQSSARSLKVDELAATLAEHLESVDGALDLLVTEMAKGQAHPELWEALHEAAVRDDKVADLAFAYEHLAQDKRVKLLAPALQADLFLHATAFFGDFFGDPDGAVGYAERALGAVPGHPEAFSRLEGLLSASKDQPRLAQLYSDAAASERDRDQQLMLLSRASELIENVEGADDLAIEIYQRILRVEPGATATRDALLARLEKAGRPRDAAKLLEQALSGDAPPDAEQADAMRARLIDLYMREIGEPQRALPHVESLLASNPQHDAARAAAEALLENKAAAARAAGALSDVYDKLGRTEDAAAMLSRELKLVRGPRRMEAQRRLAVLRMDALGDPAGALELLAPVVAADPGDDELRRRFVELSLSLNQSQEAARLLSRALQASRDPGVRARVSADIGTVHLKSGDKKRAQAAFQQAIQGGQDGAAALVAARALAELHADAGAQAPLAEALEQVVKHATDADERHAAARKLARMCEEGEGTLPERAISAWSGLIDSPWADEALRKLEVLYETSGDVESLVDILERRAHRMRDRDEARAYAFRAAELRSTRTLGRAAALAAWRALLAMYGPARDVHERMIPLLEQERQWAELAWLLEREIELAPSEERAGLYARLAQVRMTHLEDAPSALAAFRSAMAADPRERAARVGVEKLLTTGSARLEAAEILEPVYRAEEAPTGLLRVLETRGELAEESETRLNALSEAVDMAEHDLSDPARALELAGRGLYEAVRTRPALIPAWLERVQVLGAQADPALRAEKLAAALGGGVIDSPALLHLARAAAEALVGVGEAQRAVEIYRRALAFDPASVELLQRVDELLAEQGSPDERLALYRAALAEPCEPPRRRELLHAMASLLRRELGDAAGAAQTWAAALQEDPRDWGAHQGLVDLYTEHQQYEELRAELVRALEFAEGERRTQTLLRLAEAHAACGDAERALASYTEVLATSELEDDVLARVEELAARVGNAELQRTALERRVVLAGEPADTAALLERLGNLLSSAFGDQQAAVESWMRGARLSEGAADDDARARSLYERALELEPTSVDAAERWLELNARAGLWKRVPEAFGALLRASDDEREPVALLLELEPRAVEAGASDVFAALVDMVLARPNLDSVRARHLLLARARVLAADPSRHDEVAKNFRHAIETGGTDALPAAEVFEVFLANAASTPARLQDRRWLFQWRAEHSSEPADVLVAWAAAEENDFGNPRGAVELYARALEADPERIDALTEMARLEATGGDPEAAVAALKALRDRSEADARSAIELSMASLLLDPLGRADEALDLIEPLLDAAPGDPELLRLVHRAFAESSVQARAARLLDKVSGAVEDPTERAGVLSALLEMSVGATDLAEARGRWYRGLLECYGEDAEAAITVALRGAEELPHESALWDAAERLTRRLNRPELLADAYARALERPLEPELAEALGQGMVEFNEEWFDEPERVVRLLERVLELCPGAGWAFDRLKLAFNAAGRWQDLFRLYDAALEHATERPARVELLREAAMAAKDFANDTDRAIDYLERLDRESPGERTTEASLERLYERDDRTRPLIDLLSRRLGPGSAAKNQDLQKRIAGLWVDVGEAQPAFELVEAILKENSTSEYAFDLLERLIALPASRDTMAPTSAGKRKKRNFSIRDRAAERLKEHYESIGRTADVVRMLEIELEVQSAEKERARRLKEIIQLRLDALDDAAGAFESVAALVALRPSEREHRELFATLAERVGARDRQAELLVNVSRCAADPTLRLGLLEEAAGVRESLGDSAGAIELHFQVLELTRDEPEAALGSARELEKLLRAEGRAEERCGVLETLARIENDSEARRAALGAAAGVALDELHDADRATRAWRARLADDPRDAEALDGLVTSLEAAGRWDELVGALEVRAQASDDSERARADRARVAHLLAERLSDDARSIEAWRALRDSYGRDDESFGELGELLTRQERWDDLAGLLGEETDAESDPQRRAELARRLGRLHREKTGNVSAALRAYVAAGDWNAAIGVATATAHDDARARAACSELLELAVSSWGAPGESVDTLEGPAAAAAWAIRELGARLLEAGEHREAVALMLRGASLPFHRRRQRELRREAACLTSDQLGDPDGAIAIFRELFAEDPADEVASSTVTRLALLLEERGLDEEIAALWETQARCRAESGDRAAAAVLWARAAEVSEQRLGDVERAIADYRQGAALGGEACLEELARIYEARGEPKAAAEVLEWLCASSAREALAERALRLASAYVAAGMRQRARARLEQAATQAIDASAVRKRLAELYREARDFTALAALLANEAERAPDSRARLELLREAARLHLGERDAPAEAAVLLEQAVRLDPDDSALRLLLSDALGRAGRFDEAREILQAQIERYGARRPKDRALVHFALARVCLAAGLRAEALGELDVATKIDPAHPGILQLIARLAFEEGQLERAERMYRALLLVLGRGDDPDLPSRAEALLDLSEIAEQRDDAVRAGEFVESAFEAAHESSREAAALERVLAARGRHALLARAIELRLRGDVEPEHAARALGTLARLHAEHVGDLGAVASRLGERARAVHAALDERGSDDEAAWGALGGVYRLIGDGDAEARVLERRVAVWVEADELPPDAVEPLYRLSQVRLANPETRAEGLRVLERVYDLKADPERAETMLGFAFDEEPDESALALLERIARGAGRQTTLVRTLAAQTRLPSPRPQAIREAIQLAREAGNAELAQAVLSGALRAELAPEEAAWVRLELADLHAAGGALGEALDLREQAAGLLPTDRARSVLLEVARASSELAQDPDRAARVYEELLQHEPADRDVWEPLLAAYRALGARDRLIVLIDQTVPLVDALADRARLRLEQATLMIDEPGQIEPAMQLLQQVLEEDPSQQQAAALLSDLYERTGRQDELVALLVTELDAAKDRQDVGRIARVSLRLGALLEQAERSEDALDVYRAALDWDASNRDVLSAVLALVEKGDDSFATAEAIEGLLGAETGAAAADLAARLLAMRREQGDAEGEERALGLAFDADPINAELREDLVRRANERGDAAAVASVLGRAVEVGDGDPVLLARLIEAYQVAGEQERALALLETLLEKQGASPALYEQRAALLSEVGREDEALEDLERAYAASGSVPNALLEALEHAVARAEPPRDRELTLRWVEVLEQAGDVAGARGRLDELTKENPEDRDALYRLAALEERSDDWTGAVNAYRRLIALEQGEALVDAALKLADACERAGRAGDARGGLERALSAAPDHPELRLRLRRMYEAVGAHRELAELILHDAEAETEVSRRLELLLAAGELLLGPEGEPDHAIAVLEEARALSPESIEAVVLLARAYASAGRGEEGMALLAETADAHRGRRVRALAGVYREMSRIQLEEGFLSDALASLTRAFEINVRDGVIAMQLGQLALDVDEDDVATRAFRSVTMMKPFNAETGEGVTAQDRAEAHYQLARLSFKQGDPRKAKVLASKAVSENPDHEAARALLAEIG